MLKPLIDGKNDQFTGAPEAALHEDAGEVGFGTWIVAFVAGQDFLYFLGQFHGLGSPVNRRAHREISAKYNDAEDISARRSAEQGQIGWNRLLRPNFTDLTEIDGEEGAVYVPVSLQEKVPRALKDIAIYRLQRVEKALERLNGAVSRLDAAASALPVEQPKSQDVSGQNDQYDLAQAELTALRADYERLRLAATTVTGRLDDTIERLEAPQHAPKQAPA